MYMKMRTSPHKPTEPKRMCILFPNVYICDSFYTEAKGEETKIKTKKGKKQTNKDPFHVNSKPVVQYETPTETKYS